MKDIKIVFDVDDTICSNIRKLGYENCVPDLEVIKKINHLHDDLGFEIVLHTSRGMVSCNGDIDKIIEKNKSTLEKWLEKHNVHYDEIIFGKPIADLYVDDKALGIDDFKKEQFEILKGGGSGKSIYRTGKIVKKFIGSDSDTSNFKDWVDDNKGSCKFPRIISYLYNAVYMEYIHGKNLSECDLLFEDLLELIKIIVKFSRMEKSEFDICILLDILQKNYSNDKDFNRLIYLCKDALLSNKDILVENASYCHGDMILSNIIKDYCGNLFFIDSRYFRTCSSYLFDFAKLRMSMCGYEYEFEISNVDNSQHVEFLDSVLKSKGIYDIVIILQLMYVIRLYRYKDAKGKEKVKEIAKRLVNEHEELFDRYK